MDNNLDKITFIAYGLINA